MFSVFQLKTERGIRVKDIGTIYAYPYYRVCLFKIICFFITDDANQNGSLTSIQKNFCGLVRIDKTLTLYTAWLIDAQRNQQILHVLK